MDGGHHRNAYHHSDIRESYEKVNNPSNSTSTSSKSIFSRRQPSGQSHPPVSPPLSNGMWMLVDGIGLAILTTSTIFEVMSLWTNMFAAHWQNNSFALTLWLCGKSSQIIGLLFLIG